MKNIFIILALFAAATLSAWDIGIGFGYDTIDETFNSDLFVPEDRSGADRYEATVNRFAPVVQVACRYDLCGEWAWGLMAKWSYLNYITPNVGSSRGQIMPNASFSSINFFGPAIERDFTSKTRLNSEVMLLAYLGRQVLRGYAYFGLGPVVFTASNSIYLTAVHTPDGVGDHLLSTSVTRNKALFGGAFQLGYQYYLAACTMVDISYTYLQTGTYDFDNSVNTSTYNGGGVPGHATTLFLYRTLQFTTQQFILSLNQVF